MFPPIQHPLFYRGSSNLKAQKDFLENEMYLIALWVRILLTLLTL
jgi:hypothetical protein